MKNNNREIQIEYQKNKLIQWKERLNQLIMIFKNIKKNKKKKFIINPN